MENQSLKVLLLMVAGLCTACALSTMRSVYRAPEFQSAALHHVLIIGDFENQQNRKLFEDEFVRQWSRYGVQAVSSMDVLAPSAPIDKETVAPIAKAHHFDAVLVARIIENKRISPGEPATSTMTPHGGSDRQKSDSLWQVLLAPPVSSNEVRLVSVETNLYNIASESRVWSGRTETEAMKKIPTLIPPFVKLILKHLYDPKAKNGEPA